MSVGPIEKAVEKIKLRNTRSIPNPLRMSDNSISGLKDNERKN